MTIYPDGVPCAPDCSCHGLSRLALGTSPTGNEEAPGAPVNVAAEPPASFRLSCWLCDFATDSERDLLDHSKDDHFPEVDFAWPWYAGAL